MKHKVRINESAEEKEIVTNENLETIENVADETNDTVNNVIDTSNEPSVDETINEPADEPVVEPVVEPAEETSVDETINEPTDEPVDESDIEEIITKEGKVSCSKLNVRSAANKDADIIFVIIKDNVVSILDDSDEVFYRISYNGNEGYCMKEFIELL